MSLAPRGRVRTILYDTTQSPINYNDTKGNVTYELPESRPRAMQILIDMALSLGWNVYNLSRVSPYGVPYFKDMFFDAATRFPSCKFLSFANGDIMFDQGLIKTLEAVDKVEDEYEICIYIRTSIPDALHRFDSCGSSRSTRS